ncbi:MAG: type II toxin-antitoxin system PrlF family antitoxin [Pseudomonadota bacterium]|nr:type II toxin-antitoxin system PrlF family antitoxin [Pseudomonadota bacterium]
MPHSTLTTKGQTTIPADIRAFLGIKPGDELDYVKNKNGKVEIAPRKRYTWRDLAGILPAPKRMVSDAEIKQSIAEFWTRHAPKPNKRKAKRPK